MCLHGGGGGVGGELGGEKYALHVPKGYTPASQQYTAGAILINCSCQPEIQAKYALTSGLDNNMENKQID